MKKVIFTVLSCLVLGTSQASAGQYDCCAPVCNPCCDWEFTAYADYLYWEVCEGDLSLRDDVLDEVLFLNPGYNSGYRVGMRMGCGDSWDLGARYMHLDSSTSVNTADLNPLFAGNVEHSININLVDIELGYNLNFNCDNFHLRPFVGAKLAWIDNSFNTNVDLGSVFEGFSYSNDFSGYGIYTGFEGRYDLCNMDLCCSNLDIAFVARGAVGILRGSVDGKAVDINDEIDFTVDNCLYVTTVEAFVGLDFGYEWSECFAPHLMLGYEANTFIGMHQIGSTNDRTNLGLGGLVARLAVGF